MKRKKKDDVLLYLERLPIVEEQITAHGFLDKETLQDADAKIYQPVYVKEGEEDA